MIIALSVIAPMACGDEGAEPDSGIGEPAAELAGRWQGTMDGNFGSGTVEFSLREDGSITDFDSTIDFIRACPLDANSRWGVANDRFTLVGRACNGTTVTLSAPYSEDRLTGTWEGQPSGTQGSFDVARTGN